MGGGVAVVEAGDVAQQHEQIGVEQIRDQRGQAVVLTEGAAAQFLVRDDVVLVDDRDHPGGPRPARVSGPKQSVQRVPCVQVPGPIGEIGAGQQGLGGDQIMLRGADCRSAP